MAEELPCHLAALLKTLCKSARLFITLFKKDESRMRAFTEELKDISDEFKEMKDKTFWKSAGGTMLGGVGAGVLSLAAVGLGWGKMPVPAGGLTLVMGSATALTGVNAISQAIAKKAMMEKEMIKTVAQLNTRLMVIFRPLRNLLEDMKKMSEELAEKSSILVTTVGLPAYTAISEIEQFQQLLKGRNGPSEYVEATEYITQSAVQSQRTIDELAKMRSKLKEFEEN